jgi:hypothetical protein
LTIVFIIASATHSRIMLSTNSICTQPNFSQTMKTKHTPKGDTTQAKRQTRRRSLFAQKVMAAGWPSESAFVTAVINGKAAVPTPAAS